MILLNLGIAALLVAANGFFVAAEFAIVKVRVTRLEELEKRGKAGAHIARGVTENLDAYLSAAQLGITLASLALGWIGEPAVAAILRGPVGELGFSERALHSVSLAVGFALITSAHIILGEQAPKLFALARPESTTLLVAAPLRLFYWSFYPFIWTLSSLSRLLLRQFGLRELSEQDGQPGYSEQELRILLARSGTAGLLGPDAVKVVQRALSFPTRTARQVMVPRNQVIFFYDEQPTDEVLDVAAQSGHTRFPVVAEKGDLDALTGILNVKDLLLALQHGTRVTRLGELARKPLYIPETVMAPQLLRSMHEHREQIAVVVDEHGGTAGLVTLADVVEEVLGPVPEEGSSRLSTLPEAAEIIEGSTPLLELAERIGVELPEKPPATVAGYLIQKLEKIPNVGERTELGDHELIVEAVEGPRISRIRVVPGITGRPPSGTPKSRPPSGTPKSRPVTTT